MIRMAAVLEVFSFFKTNVSDDSAPFVMAARKRATPSQFDIVILDKFFAHEKFRKLIIFKVLSLSIVQNFFSRNTS